MSEAAFLTALVVDGALAGTIYALIALAFVVVYKASRLMNFALGEWVLLGSRLAGSGFHIFGLGVIGALLFACAGLLALASVFSRVVLRRLAGQPLISLLMVGLALGVLIRGAVPLVFAGVPGQIPLPVPDEPLAIHGVPVPGDKLVAAGIAVLGIVLLSWFFRASRTGLALRAIASDAQVAAAMGISLHRHIAVAWALAGVLAVLGGTLWSAVAGGGFGLEVLGFKVFPVVILGGLDSIPGAIVAAVIVGVLESVTLGYVDPVVGSGFSRVVAYALLLATLFVRPHGLFGRPEVARPG